MFAPLHDGPYYAVIFASQANQTEAGQSGYLEMARNMVELAAQQPGYIGVESARNTEGFGMTVSYWESEEAIKNWREHAIHIMAQKLGKDRWYNHYTLRIAKIERSYEGPEGRD